MTEWSRQLPRLDQSGDVKFYRDKIVLSNSVIFECHLPEVLDRILDIGYFENDQVIFKVEQKGVLRGDINIIPVVMEDNPNWKFMVGYPAFIRLLNGV